MRTKNGRCQPCGVIFEWRGSPLVRDALCPRCTRPLSRTAVALVKRIPIVEETPDRRRDLIG